MGIRMTHLEEGISLEALALGTCRLIALLLPATGQELEALPRG